MKRVTILGVIGLIGCGGGSDHPPALLQSNAEGGKAATGGHKSVAGAAGRVGSSGSAGRSGGGAAGSSGSAGNAGHTNSNLTNAGTANGGNGLNLAGASGQIVRPVAPIVLITSPVEVTDPNAPIGVIGGDSYDVTCTIAKGSAEGATVDPESLKIQLVQKGVAYDPTTNNLPVGNSRKQSFGLAALEAGPATIVCTGNDKSSEPIASTAQINTLIDRGPEIEILEPKDRAPWNAAAPVKVRFTVTPKELPNLTSIPDTKAAVAATDIKVKVNSSTFSATPNPTTPNEYVTRDIYLDSRTDFPTGDLPANLTPIYITATNRRGMEATASLRINVDNTAPVISIKSPDPTKAAVIGGASKLVFEVTDPAVGGEAGTGVDIASVTVLINNDSKEKAYGTKPDIARWTHTTDAGIERFTFNFELEDFKGSGNQVTVQVVASDYASNKTLSGNTASYFVDTTPPFVDLDPPTVRELLKDNGIAKETSAFDPLGNAVNDLEVISGDNFFRVLAWERANYSEAVEYIAGISNLQTASTDAPVQLWLQADVTQPLLSDTDHDGICDDINTAAAHPPIPKNLVPITPAGTAPRFKKGDPNADDLRYWPAPNGGYAQMSPEKLPDFLCAGNTSSLTRVIKHNVVSSTAVPVIYGLEPAVDATCTGNFWGIVASVIAARGKADGWICAAARAVDNVGNVGVSRVIHLCLDAPNDGEHPTCATNLQPSPPPADIPAWVTAWASADPSRRSATPPRSAEPLPKIIDPATNVSRDICEPVTPCTVPKTVIGYVSAF